ncbi:MAG: hypothetical protein ACK4N5_18085 [Myxococcales bacterium]
MRVRQLDLPLLQSRQASLPGAARPRALGEPDEYPFEPEGEAANDAVESEAPLVDRPVRPLPSRDQMLVSARNLAAALSDELSRPVRLYVTDNRATMVSFRRAREGLTLRVHHMFLDAPPHVVKALADYAGRGTRTAGTVIDRFVRDHSDAIRAGEADRRAQRLNPRGTCYDLKELYDRLNATEFDGRIRARIGWGRGTQERRRRTIRMGVYDHLSRTIRIHPALDRPEVPEFFVAYIVFHEMLHQAIPCKEEGGRRQHHSPEFRAREQQYPDYERAIAWEKQHLHLLLGRSGPRRFRPD